MWERGTRCGEYDELRVLIVDDDQARHGTIAMIVARLNRLGREVKLVRRYGPAAVTDADLQWAQFVFLDHDMCQQGYTDADGLYVPDPQRPCPSPVEKGTNMLNSRCGCPTGMDLVVRIAALPKKPAVIVHTQNSDAAPKMMEALRKAGVHHTRIPANEFSSETNRRWLAGWVARLHDLLILQPQQA